MVLKLLLLDPSYKVNNGIQAEFSVAGLGSFYGRDAVIDFFGDKLGYFTTINFNFSK